MLFVGLHPSSQYFHTDYAAMSETGEVIYPTYFADFVNQKYVKGLYNTIPLDSSFNDAITSFTRATSASYYDTNGNLQTAGPNVPRFDYNPRTLQPRGLLGEGPNTNLLYPSADFGDSRWIKTRTSMAATSDGFKLTSSNTLDSHYAFIVIPSIVSGVTYTQWYVVSAAEHEWCQITFSSGTFSTNNWANFNLRGAGSIGNKGSLGTPGIRHIGNGKYLIWITATANNTSDITQAAVLASTNGTNSVDRLPNFTGDSTSGFVAHYAQFEESPFPTSYIPTTSSPVTRTSGICLNSILNWYAQGKGTVIVEWEPSQVTLPGSGIVEFGDGTVNNLVSLRMSTLTSTTLVATTRTFNSVRHNFPTLNIQPFTTYKAAYAFQGSSGNACYVNGIAASDASSSTQTPTNSNIFELFATRSSSNRLYGWIRSITYYSRRLAPAELSRLSTPWWKKDYNSSTGKSPKWIMDLETQRYAKSISPSGDAVESSFFGMLEGFTRNSSATYHDKQGNLKTALPNQPRFMFDTGELLIENGSTNLIGQSNAIAGSSWSRGGITVGSEFNHKGYILQTVTQTSSNSVHEFFANAGVNRFAATAGTNYAIGFVIKRGTQRYVTVGMGNGAATRSEIGCTFDFETNQIVASGASSPGTIQSTLLNAYIDKIIDNDTFRIVVVGTFSDITVGIPFSHARTTPTYGGAPSFTGSTSNSYSIGDITAEVGNFATSLIRSSGTSTTRARDNLVTNIVNWANQTSGTFIIEGKFNGLVSTVGQQLINFNNGTTSGDIRLFKSLTSNRLQAGVESNLSDFGNTLSLNTKYKAAIRYKTGNNGFFIDGQKISSPTFEGTTISTVQSQLNIGNRANGDRPFSGTINKVLYFAEDLTDNEIIELTS